MTTAEYIDLVDRSGRMMRPGKRGDIDPELEPILLRIGANPDAWLDKILDTHYPTARSRESVDTDFSCVFPDLAPKPGG